MDVMLIPIICSLGAFTMVVLIVFFIMRAKQARIRHQAEVQTKLIEKFGNSPELITFLKSEEGREFLGIVESAPRQAAGERLLLGLRRAIVFSFLGVAFLLLCIPEDVRNEGFMIAGVVLLALGAGHFVSTLISVRLSRSWGLVDSKDQAALPKE
jgi:hypothetical protein